MGPMGSRAQTVPNWLRCFKCRTNWIGVRDRLRERSSVYYTSLRKRFRTSPSKSYSCRINPFKDCTMFHAIGTKKMTREHRNIRTFPRASEARTQTRRGYYECKSNCEGLCWTRQVTSGRLARIGATSPSDWSTLRDGVPGKAPSFGGALRSLILRSYGLVTGLQGFYTYPRHQCPKCSGNLGYSRRN